ncbi:BACON domain-containing protein [Wenyingzhuangia aestuarii]|uniref:BACON domain-containing protein n=1 Tax=Wenyingzhuangia aestuarii TaxID=1647582 RepID=UPI00143B910D|nr:BACON domain-containing protein [Wenyingzhuangia aestuarii]NJB82494.1 hypothetical protein [Wenyingzhuangia aestuarii]
MYTNNVFTMQRIVRLFYTLLVICLTGLTSCTNDENEFSGDPYFVIEDQPTGISADTQGITQSYVVRSNRPWKIVAQNEATWAQAFPNEGEDDGIFKFIVDENLTFDARTINFAFVVNGEEQPVLFRVDQIANIPFIVVENAAEGISVPSAATTFSIPVKANVNWTYTLVDGDWLSEVTLTENELNLIAVKNRGEERVATVKISAEGHPTLDTEITITQSAGDVILEENFDWLNYGSPVFYTYSGEGRMDDVWTADELAKGWTSTENEFASNQQVVYARPGFVKLGRTSYGGDLISPRLTGLEEATTVKVSFKAVPYKTKGGTQDDHTLKVSVIGDGETSVSSITVDNWPDYATDPDCTLIWEEERSQYEFTITGATSETQLKFLGGDYLLKGVGKGKNRIFIDDIKVTIVE